MANIALLIARDSSVVLDQGMAETYLRYAQMITDRGYVSAAIGNMVMRQSHPRYPDGINAE